MKKAFFIGTISVLILALASPAFSGDYKRRGTIHLQTGGWACDMTPYHIGRHHIYLTNRGDKKIDFHIDFYGLNSAGNTERVARIPASGDISVPPHWTESIHTNFSGIHPDLASVRNTMTCPVIVWSGKVDTGPGCVVKVEDIDENGNKVCALGVVMYDDHMK